MDLINTHTYQVHESSAPARPNMVPTFTTSGGKSFSLLYCLTGKIFGDLGEIRALLLDNDIKDATLLYNALFSKSIGMQGTNISEWKEDINLAQSGIDGLTKEVNAISPTHPLTDQFLIDNPKLCTALSDGSVSKSFDDFKEGISSKISKLQDDFASGTYPEVIKDIEAIISHNSLKQTTADSPFWTFRNSLADFLSPAYQSALPQLPPLYIRSKDIAESAAERLSVILAKEDFDLEFMNLSNSTGYTIDANAIFNHEVNCSGQNTFRIVGESALTDVKSDLESAARDDDPYFTTHTAMYNDFKNNGELDQDIAKDVDDIKSMDMAPNPFHVEKREFAILNAQNDFDATLIALLKEMSPNMNKNA